MSAPFATAVAKVAGLPRGASSMLLLESFAAALFSGGGAFQWCHSEVRSNGLRRRADGVADDRIFRCLWWAVWLLGDAAARDSELNAGWAMPTR